MADRPAARSRSQSSRPLISNLALSLIKIRSILDYPESKLSPLPSSSRLVISSRPCCRPALRLVLRSVPRSVPRSSVGSSHPSSLAVVAASCTVSFARRLSSHPSFRSPSRLSFRPPPSHPPSHPSSRPRRNLIRRLSAACAVPFCLSLIISSRPSSRRLVHRSSARLCSPFPRHGRRGVFLFSFDSGRGEQAREQGRRRAGDGLGRAGRARSIVIGRSYDGALASKQAGALDRQI